MTAKPNNRPPSTVHRPPIKNMTYQTYKVTIEDKIAIVAFNRPDKANAMNKTAWIEMQQVFEDLDAKPEVRAIILAGEGKHFCAGIDLQMLMGDVTANGIKCEGRKREAFYHNVTKMQANVSAIEKCRKPVIAAVQNVCYGAGLDVITACDIRYCTESARFCIKEVDVGLVADIGVLQRMPKIVNPGMVAEMAYTGKVATAAEAKEMGLVSRVFDDKPKMMEAAIELAKQIASKPPLVIRGTKQMLLYARDNAVDKALDYQVLWNAAHIYSNDLQEAGMAFMQKREPVFED